MIYTIKPNRDGFTVTCENQTIAESYANTARKYDGYLNGSLQYIFEQIEAIEKCERELETRKVGCK